MIKTINQEKSVLQSKLISEAISFNQSAAIVVLVMIFLNVVQIFGFYLSYAGSFIGLLGIYYAVRAHIASSKASVSIIGPLCIYGLNIVGLIGIGLSLFGIYLPTTVLGVLLLINYALTIAAIVFCFRTSSGLRKKHPDIKVTYPTSILKGVTKRKNKN
ncbi:hypothetical protein [Lactovum miscens]|uniref:Uncharacterized protein n=1 Tax=Lactovum miscens TaxID=190387 RepID=A0A841C389_9LACT|nr:hypothetical protein [Lactovum miscens]MBB5888426.1 hypothetical protein [Lactovum miscens]